MMVFVIDDKIFYQEIKHCYIFKTGFNHPVKLHKIFYYFIQILLNLKLIRYFGFIN